MSNTSDGDDRETDKTGENIFQVDEVFCTTRSEKNVSNVEKKIVLFKYPWTC